MVICPNPRCRVSYPAGTTQCTNPFCLCLLPEAIVAGRYRIETLIGLGGMGAVYRVSDTFEMQQVALKVISTVGSFGNTDIATAVERFRREARYAFQLRHKNIVPILNFGQDGLLLYIAMPLVTGGTLKSLLKAERPLPLALTQRYLNELADAIDAIHAHPQQIVHRDIKPSNLLIHQDDGRLVVADFGIARAMQREHALTQRGWSVGTEHYAAPEQEHGRAVPASDIYSMSVVAYQMLTGMLPFQAVVQSHSAELPTPSQLNTAVPAAVDAVIERAMDIEPRNRYASAKAFADAFNNALATPLSALASSTPLEDLPTIRVSAGNDNILVHTITPENSCAHCGQENRSSSRFCRHCGHGLDETLPTITDMCQVGYTSDKGQRSGIQENEDMLLIVQGLCVNLAPPRPFGLFAVADGLRGPQGKAAGGHEASRLAVDTIADVLLPPLTIPFPSSNSMKYTGSTSSVKKDFLTSTAYALPTSEGIIEQLLRDAVRQANKVIYHCNADYETTMASTLTVTLLHEHILYVAGFGDSRAYHYNATTGLRHVTTEHTLQADAPKPGTLPDSPGSNLHYSYLGLASEIQIDTFRHPVEANDLILLCTDGLWKMVSDAMLQQMLAQSLDRDPQEIAPLLVDAANNAGGKGNVSAIVVRIL
jgi:eukaryotic-like serine/threonine-protein kinase